MYDLAVIGGGPAGYSAALEAARLKQKVILFEEDRLGGTCLNRGCVPTKYLAHVARVFSELNTIGSHGIMLSGAAIDYGRTTRRKNEIIHIMGERLERQIRSSRIEIVQGAADIGDPGHVLCGGNVYEVRNILIASGSMPAVPYIHGAVTSDELLEMDRLPKRLHILGGGTAAVEFANIFCRLGVEVTVSIRGERILKRWDREIASGLMQSMKQKGIEIRKNCDFHALETEPETVVLSAMGRRPRTSGLNQSFFERGDGGGIVADSFGRTRTNGIFAAGDVIDGSPGLAHTGMAQGRRVAQYIAGQETERESTVVSCIYMDIEIASVGLTEAAAREDGIPVLTSKQNMYTNARTMISTSERGFIKLVADKDTQKLLGAQLMCERAGDIAGELALAINQGLTVRELRMSVRPHPSYCEAVTEAAQVLEDKFHEI